MTEISQSVSIAELRRAIEARDARALSSMYADDALLYSIDHDNPPSRPRVLEGRQAIAAWYDDVCGRAVSHRVDSAVTGGEALSFTQTCTYPDGAKVFCAATLEIKDGKIVRQTIVQAWDS
jgi:ketosteroid isomerase-like protein